MSRQGSSSRLQRTYAYNVRSQLTSSASPLFTEKIYYESPRGNGATPCFNGDISSVSWSEKTAVAKTSDMRHYDYSYDALDRLTGSRYSDYKNRTGFFDTDYIYDKQGNILDFIRTNVDPTDNTRTILVDDASFRYDGNQLMAYSDIGMETCSPDITLPNNYDDIDGNDQFSYDACGNMTANTNKGIVKMTYNLLNQPASIYFRDGTVIRYDYSADGERLRARYGTVKYNVAIPEAGIMTADFQPSDTTGYNIQSTRVYDGRYTFYSYHSKTGKLCAKLEYIRIDGGIVEEFRKDYPTLLYEITDHQGNVRYVATDSGAYETMYQYYPFGGYFDGGYVHPYLYGGKEMEESNGLDEYDFEARNYDPALCRFNTMDPLSEKYYSISPYAYCADNPIRYVDPDGLGWVGSKGEDGTISWTWDDNVKSMNEAKQAGYFDYLEPGSIIDNGTINGHVGEDGKTSVYLGYNKNDVSFTWPNSKVTPFEVGTEWLTGEGPRHRDFTNGDLFTEMLRTHEHVRNTIDDIKNLILSGSSLREGYSNYSLSGLGGVLKYMKDYSTLLTGGLTGNLAVTYLGSYTLNWRITNITKESFFISFMVNNTSTIQSGTRPPVIGYTDFWQKNIGGPLNKAFESGPMSETSQTFKWTEKVKL